MPTFSRLSFVICFALFGIFFAFQASQEIEYQERFRASVCIIMSYICLRCINYYTSDTNKPYDKHRNRSLDRNK